MSQHFSNTNNNSSSSAWINTNSSDPHQINNNTYNFDINTALGSSALPNQDPSLNPSIFNGISSSDIISDLNSKSNATTNNDWFKAPISGSILNSVISSDRGNNNVHDILSSKDVNAPLSDLNNLSLENDHPQQQSLFSRLASDIPSNSDNQTTNSSTIPTRVSSVSLLQNPLLSSASSPSTAAAALTTTASSTEKLVTTVGTSSNISSNSSTMTPSQMPLTQGVPPPPPGLYTPLIPPDQMNWLYLDSQNQIQGPFVGTIMQSWYSQGYFSYDLKIKRSSEPLFYSLNSFMSSIQNNITPFLTALPATTSEFTPSQQQQQSFMGSNMFGSNAGFDLTNNRSSINVSASADTQDRVINNSINNEPSSSAIAAASTNAPEKTSNASESENKNVSRDLIQHAHPDTSNKDPLASIFLGSVIDDNDSESVAKVAPASVAYDEIAQTNPSNFLNGKQQVTLEPKAVVQQIDSEISVKQSISPKKMASRFTDQVQQPQQQLSKKSVDSKKLSSQKKQDQSSKSSYNKVPSSSCNNAGSGSNSGNKVLISPKASNKKDAESSSNPVIEKLIPAVSTKSNLAPWAAKAAPASNTNGKSIASVTKEPKISLQEILKMEAEEKRKKQKEKEIQSAKILSEIMREEQQQKKILEANKRVVANGWGLNSASQPIQTMQDILKEEKKASVIKKSILPTSSIESASSKDFDSDGSSLSTSGDTWKVVNKNTAPTATTIQYKVSTGATTGASASTLKFASIAASSKPATSGSNNSSSIRSINTSKKTVSSSNHINSSNISSSASSMIFSNTVSSNKLRREFLAWCRSELRGLNSGVNKEDILSIFFQFPNGKESKDLISDTIYSSSKTMNGRRFAEEFIKRRKMVEKVSVTINWDEALRMNPDDEDEDEWTTTVNKKKHRK